MTITLTREEAQQVLHSLLNYPMTQGKAIQLLSAKLNEPELIQLSPHEFIKTVTGKEDLVGMPVMMSVWPTAEEVTGEQQ